MNLLQRELCRIRESRLVRNTGWMAAGQGAGIVLQSAYFVLIARLLGAGQYGIYAGAFAFTNIAAQYTSLGTGVVFIRYVAGNRKAFTVYWGNILLVTAGLGTLLTVGLAYLAPHLLNPASAAIVPLAAAANCLCAQITVEAGRVFQAFEQLRTTAVLNLLVSLLRTLAAAAMLLTLHHAIAWQWAVVSLIISAVAAVAAIGNVTRHFGSPAFRFRPFADHGLEGLGYCFAGSTTVVYNDIDKVMLSHYGMNVANGIYTMAYRVIDMASIPISSIQAATIAQFFQCGRTGLPAAAAFSHRLLKRALPISAMLAVGMFVTAPLIPRVVGPGFAQSVSALRWLCLIPVFRSVQLMAGCALTGAGLQRYRTAAQVLTVGLNLGLNCWWIPKYGWRGAAVSSLLTDGFIAAMNLGLLQVLKAQRKPDASEVAA